MAKIFVIGFNKCGTTSLHNLFSKSGYRSVHWRLKKENVFLATAIFTNHSLNRKLLDGIDQFDIYSDLVFLSENIHLEANIFFQNLDEQYPDSRFILNTRNKENWLESRSRHSAIGAGSMIERACACYRESEEAVKTAWSAQWDSHHDKVRKYFADRTNFLEFDIEKDPVSKISGFLSDRRPIKEAEWRKLNQTA